MHFIRIVRTLDYANYIAWDFLFNNIISNLSVSSQISLRQTQDSNQFIISQALVPQEVFGNEWILDFYNSSVKKERKKGMKK